MSTPLGCKISIAAFYFYKRCLNYWGHCYTCTDHWTAFGKNWKFHQWMFMDFHSDIIFGRWTGRWRCLYESQRLHYWNPKYREVHKM